jgi:hypothetical protein
MGSVGVCRPDHGVIPTVAELGRIGDGHAGTLDKPRATAVLDALLH